MIVSILLNYFIEDDFVLPSLIKFIPMGYILLSARAFEVACFIIMGHIFAQRKVLIFENRVVVGCLAFTFIGSFFWRINTGEMFFDNLRYLPYMVTAILSTWSIFSLSKRYEPKGIISDVFTFIGNNTLTILTWHFLVFKVVSYVIIKIYCLPIIRLHETPILHEYASNGWWIAYFMVSMVICCGIAYCNKWVKTSWLKL